MGFFDGLLGPALNVGTGAVAAQQGAQTEVNKTNLSNALALLAAKRASDQAQSEADLRNAQATFYRGPKTGQAESVIDKNNATTPTIAPTAAAKTALDMLKADRLSNEPAPQSPTDIHAADRQFDVDHPLPTTTPAASFVFPTVTDANGNQVVAAADTKTGRVTPTTIGAKAPAAGTNANAAKAKALVDLIAQSYPQIETLTPKIRPSVVSLAVKYPMAGNLALNQDEQNYLSAFRDALAGVLHEESGARLSHEQLQFGYQRYGPLPGDSPATMATKLAALKQTLNDRVREFQTTPPGGGPPPTNAPVSPSDPILDKYGLTPKKPPTDE